MDNIQYYTSIIIPVLAFISGGIIFYFKNKSTVKQLKINEENLKLEKQEFERKLRVEKREKQEFERRLAIEQKENKERKHKLDFLSSIMNLSKVNQIVEASSRMFNNTRADRFLILIAINGKTDFNIVSVVFEQHRGEHERVNAIGTYKETKIDLAYKNMLKIAEGQEFVSVKTDEMEDSLLRSFYQLEGVKHSQIRFLGRQAINEDDDFIVFSSLATHKIKPFTRLENVFIKTVYEGTIIPAIQDVTN